MAWRGETRCARLEIVLDIAGLANTGGGHLVIGRHEPDYKTGTLTDEQLRSFDPTEVNAFVRRVLTPPIECQLHEYAVGDDVVMIVEVPGFESVPLLFYKSGDCGRADCKKQPHFLPGDVFIRSKAMESRRVVDVEEMREIIDRAVRKREAELFDGFHRILRAPQDIETPQLASSYDAELAQEGDDFFRPVFSPWVAQLGHFDLTIRPTAYREDRIELARTPRDIREFSFVVLRNGIPEGIPYEHNTNGENAPLGARLLLQKPQWRQIEAASLSTSALYRIVRAFPEDYQPDADGTRAEVALGARVLWVDHFVNQMTMFHLLARNVALRVTEDEDEEVQFDLRVDGLEGRATALNMPDPLVEFRIGIGQQTGTKNVFDFTLRTTPRELKANAMSLAREHCKRILWTFGISEAAIIGFQRRLFGGIKDVWPSE